MSAVAILESDLHAYADRQLPPEQIAAVEAALARDPALAARVADIRGQNAALRDALDPLLAEPIPQRLLDAARPPPAGAVTARGDGACRCSPRRRPLSSASRSAGSAAMR